MKSPSSSSKFIIPRLYQQDVLKALRKHPDRNQIVHLAFGAGKTLIALWEMIHRRQAIPTKKILYLSAGGGWYDRARQALDMSIQFGLQSSLGFCLDPKLMLDRASRKSKEMAWKKANVIFGPLQSVWNSLNRDFPGLPVSFIVIDEIADIVSRDLTGWRFHKSVTSLMNFAGKSDIPILGLTGTLNPSRLNAIVRLTGAKLLTRLDIQPFTYEYSTLLIQDQDIQRLDHLFGAGLNECTQRASILLDYPLNVELMYELLYGGLLNRLYQPRASFPGDTPLFEKLKSNDERDVLSQILRDFHLYAHGRVITLNSTPEHLVTFLDKYRLHGKMRFQLKEAAINRWKRTALASKVLRAVIPIRHASKESPVIVFGRFLNLVDQCQKVLIANGVKAHQLTGNMKPPTRRVILREFREKEYPVLVLSPLGTRGLDLPEVGLVVHLDITQSVDIIAQRSARIRGGQVWFVISADTSEEAKLRLVEDRLSPSKRYIAPSFPSIRKNKITEELKLVDESQNLKEEHRELLDWFQRSKGEEL